jgi:ABC-type branched-subunit amino acid transport system ATPase component
MALLESFGLADLADATMGELPLGQVRLLDVARAMAMRPKYLLLDEPAAGLAANEQQMLSGQIRRIAAEGVGVLLVEHNFQLVRSLADEVVVLQKGQMLMTGAPEKVADDPRVVDAYLGSLHSAGASDSPAGPGPAGPGPATPEAATPEAARRGSASRADQVVLSCHGLQVSYGRATVCHDIEMSLRAGRLTALLGPNGAGKSTLMAALAGNRLDNRRWSGEVSLDGVRIERLGAVQRARVGVAFVPEARGNVFAGLTVDENLRLCLRQLAPADRDATLELIMEVFPQLTALLDARAGMLSGGEQQMVAIGMALARRPKVLLLDEPSQGLAPAVLDVLVDAFTTLRERDLSILLAEQNQAFAAALADDFLVLAHGEVVAVGGAEELKRRDEIAAAYL